MKKLVTPLPDILARVRLDLASLALIAQAQTPAEALAILEHEKRWVDAVNVFAQALPKREAVWWACVCARAAPEPEPRAPDLEAVAAADAWVRRPDEANRRAAMAAAQKAELRSPEAWAAVAAFWSGGSLGPETAAEIPPGEHLTGVAVASAVILAAVRQEPEKAMQKYLRSLVSAYDIAQGGGGWLGIEGA